MGHPDARIRAISGLTDIIDQATAQLDTRGEMANIYAYGMGATSATPTLYPAFYLTIA